MEYLYNRCANDGLVCAAKIQFFIQSTKPPAQFIASFLYSYQVRLSIKFAFLSSSSFNQVCLPIRSPYFPMKIC